MEKLLSLVWIWGLVDSIWLAVDPPGWSRFWGRFLGFLGRDRVAPRALATFEAALCLFMLGRAIRRGP